MTDIDQEDLALQKRKYIYRHRLYVKHVASNRFTRVGPSIHQGLWQTAECHTAVSRSHSSAIQQLARAEAAVDEVAQARTAGLRRR